MFNFYILYLLGRCYVEFLVGSNSYGKVKTFRYLGSFFNKSKFFSRWNKMKTAGGKFMLLFSPNTFVFSSSLQKFKIKTYKQ